MPLPLDHVDLVPPQHLDGGAFVAAERSGVPRAAGAAPFVALDHVAPALPGTRVGVLSHHWPGHWADPLWLEARGVGADLAAGPWVPLAESFRAEGGRVWVADLGGAWPEAELRAWSADPEGVAALDWELLTPSGEARLPLTPARLAPTPARDEGGPGRGAHRRGSSPWEGEELGRPDPLSLDGRLAYIGVVSREDWGARGTTCTTPEDHWYRMAIHHSAGGQTYGGTTMGEVQLLQAYAQDSGEYCDVPYQFLVGYDGSLFEGRPLAYYSGATGGGNNDGNIAVCFMGCYHPSDCPTGSNAVTTEMLRSGHLLTQTLAAQWGFASNSSTIMGHRDYPDNATACPGDWLHDRLDDLRSPAAPYAGALVGSSFSGGVVEARVGETVTGWIEIQNTGAGAWSPGWTNLALLPRDSTSAFHDASWYSTTRVATVPAVVQPGEVARFPVALHAAAVTDETLSFALVQEWFTWFADAPYGGGPAEGAITLRLVVSDGGGDSGGDNGDSGGDNGDSGGDNGAGDNGDVGGGGDDTAGLDGAGPGGRTEMPLGCAVGPVGPGGAAGVALAGLLLLGTRRRAASPPARAARVARHRRLEWRAGPARGGLAGQAPRRAAEDDVRALPPGRFRGPA